MSALANSAERTWTAARLKRFIARAFPPHSIVIVSDSEPVRHVREAQAVRSVRPASGLVTALEPIALASGGVWVARASGDADRATGERVDVPEDDPTYTLRRIYLDPAEVAGYYRGFSNQALWPLCHTVHERPVLRHDDWDRYQAVNATFAGVVLEEIEKAEAPVILVQDYHLALLPALVRRERPDARIALFWHIPWPNAETFSICPWQEEILLGMLGADLIGFHTPRYCHNFLATVGRAGAARIAWSPPAVVRRQRVTRVRALPIGVPLGDGHIPTSRPPAFLSELRSSAEFLGLGIDRIDYTKGLPERLRAIRRFFERCPEYRRRLVFLQIAVPSRDGIARYRQLRAEVQDTARRINAELADEGWRPLVYLEGHRDRSELAACYRAADFCLVSSLHDGMNLVAKEFVASRDDGDGVLILSRFAGAARELSAALLINPYDFDETARAIQDALEMAAEERRRRMGRMRAHVRRHNAYRWAARLLAALARTGERPAAPSG
jgi:alpha,alpha-trehalose-phosphate synthase [UDP-forming]